jgi:hypothetical protein
MQEARSENERKRRGLSVLIDLDELLAPIYHPTTRSNPLLGNGLAAFSMAEFTSTPYQDSVDSILLR